ncbi:MAG: methyltransferase domain-containing protein [Kiritimatiellia bacterium]
MSDPAQPPEFDDFAGNYDDALRQGLSVSGEDKDFFAEGRVRWLRHCLEKQGEALPGSVLDFGCGTGSATPFLRAHLSPGRIAGVDVSRKSVEVAARNHPDPRNHFAVLDPAAPPPAVGLAFCNGVFHHIPRRTSRRRALRVQRTASGRASPSGKTTPGIPAPAWS